MKFVKSDFAKKIIIILIVILISNVALPHQVNAIDVEGVLFKPIASIIFSIIFTFDVTLSAILNGISLGADRIRDFSK